MRYQPIEIEIGTKIRDWTVVGFNEKKKKGRHYFFRCKCGKVLSKPIGDFIRCGPKSCKSCACKFRGFNYLGNKPLQLAGKTFGKWIVLERVFNGKRGTYWKCKCACGKVFDIFGPELKRGKTSKCRFCAARGASLVHGQGTRGKITPEYNSWSQMKTRCLNPNDKRYSDYGGRGIKVCQEWTDSFEAFFKYIGEKPSKSHSLDRINNNGNYEPGNVQWATPLEQASNRRKRVISD